MDLYAVGVARTGPERESFSIKFRLQARCRALAETLRALVSFEVTAWYILGVQRFSTLALSFGLSFLVGACGHDVGHHGELVGGSCDQDSDCVEACVTGGDFPGGTCTVECDEDYDCPSGTLCIDKKGGICLLACDHDEECRSGYECKDEKREGQGGRAEVCID